MEVIIAMKLSPASLLILTMFGSFTVIIILMILIFRPEPRVARPRTGRTVSVPPRSAPRDATTRPDVTVRSQSAPDTVQTDPKPQKAPIPPPVPKLGARPDSKLYWDLKREQKEMARLKADMERRLKDKLATNTQKYAQIARACESLEPGEAVQILQKLDDTTVSEVLRRMDRDKALPIAALFKRLGREKAISVK